MNEIQSLSLGEPINGEPNVIGSAEQSAQPESQLVRYDAMCRAIDAAYEVDEVKEFRDKAIALETYARQARNIEAERRATTIRIKAERKAGELLAAMKKAKGGAEKGTKRDGPGGKVMQSDGPTALRDIGISKQQSSDWQKLAAVPQKRFEAALADKSKMPSTAAIIRENTPRRPPHQQKPPATVGDVAKAETSPITAAPAVVPPANVTPAEVLVIARKLRVEEHRPEYLTVFDWVETQALLMVGDYAAMRNVINTPFNIDEIRNLSESDRNRALVLKAGQLKNIRGNAIALEACAKDKEAKRGARKTSVQAERRIGQFLTETVDLRDRGKPPKGIRIGRCKLLKLEALGISRKESQDWRMVARIPEPDFEAALADSSRMPSTAGLLRRFQYLFKPKRPEGDPLESTPPEDSARVNDVASSEDAAAATPPEPIKPEATEEQPTAPI
jgi:hypothetical protein